MRSREKLLEEIQALSARIDKLEGGGKEEAPNTDEQKRFRDIAEAASDWFWEMDENLRFSYFSNRFTEITGVPSDALLGKTREETGIPDLDPESWRKHLADLAAHRSFREFYHPRTLSDGRIVHVSINGKAVFDDAGRFKGYRGTGSDITERIRAEESQRKTDALFKETERLARLGHWEWDEVEDRCTYCSVELARLHGITVEEYLEQTPSLAADIEWVHPEDRRQFQDAANRLREKGERFEFEYRLRQPDGSYIEVREEGEPVFDEQGSVIRTFGFVQDITERKRAERALRQARNELEQRVEERTAALSETSTLLSDAIESISEGFVLYDAELRFVRCNSKYLDLYPALADILKPGAKFEDIVRTAYERDAVQAPGMTAEEWVDKLATQHRAAIGSHEQLLADGRWVLCSERRTSTGGTVGIRTDITERKLAEQEAERSRALLASAVEALDEGFVIFDDDDRMVLCNDTYRDIYRPAGESWPPGITMEEVARDTARHCFRLEDEGEIEAWARRRMEQHRKPGVPFEQELQGGRWIRAREYLLPNGWTVGTRSDITDLKRTEEKLRASQARLIDAIESISEGFVLFDADERLVLCNSMYRAFFPEIAELMVPGAQLEDVLRAAGERGQMTEATGDVEAWLETRLTHYRTDHEPIEQQTGDERWLLISDRRTREGGIVGIRTDITERKLAEVALRERETMLNSLIENVPMSLCLKDLEGRFTLINPGFERLHNVSNDEILGKTFFDILPHEVAADAAAEDRQVIECGETLRTEYAWPSHLGNLHELIFKFPLRRDDQDPIAGVGVIALDVSEQKWAESELRESEARYREIFEESPLPLLEEDWQPVKRILDDLAAHGVTDIPGYFHDHPDELGRVYDAARRFGVSKATVELYRAESEATFRASLAQDAADPDELAGYSEMIAAFYGGAATYEYEAEEVACDGSELVTRIRVVIPPNYRETWSRVLVTMEDITHRRETEQAVLMAKDQAEIANRAKSEFLANMSHELRTPLNAIIGFAEIIKDQRLGPLQNARYREYVGDIHASGQHLLDLINDILDLSKIETGDTTLQEDVLDVAEILRICLRLVDERAKNHGLELVTELPDASLPGLVADPRLVKQILINLLSNALKFTPSGGRVTVGLRASSDEGYLLQVTDTGIGMSPQDIPKALTRFQQIDGHLNRRFQGTGLGLPLTKSLVELHGGTLEIESALGEGTSVTIRFPAERLVARRRTPQVAEERAAVRG